jgi:uncharacterized protein (TIGR00290 family)
VKPDVIPVILSWSGGKDSALALHVLQQQPEYTVCGLLTSINDHYGRISMHGVRESLLDAQASAIGLPLYKVRLSERPSNEEYEQRMQSVLESFQPRGIRHVAFGDLFLEDIRQYRIAQLQRVGMQALFPLWQRSTATLAREFIALGFKARLCCVDGMALDETFAGRVYDDALLHDLPAGIDPCGENGEFHSFVYDGPVFRCAIPVRTGDRITREQRFHFCDLFAAEA